MNERNPFSFKLVVCVVIIMLIFIPSSAALAAESPVQGAVTITTGYTLKLRSGPGAGYDQIGTVPYNTTLPVLGRDEGANWVFVDYSGARGWIAAWLATVSGDLNSVPVGAPDDGGGSAPPPESGSAPSGVTAIPTTTLRIRSGAGTDYPQVGTIPAGVEVPVLAYDAAANWIYVDYAGAQGWSAAWLATVNGDLNTLGSQPGAAPGAAPTEPPAPGPVTATVIGQSFLHAGPDNDTEWSVLIPGHTAVPVLGYDAVENWIYVEYQGLRGWINARFSRISGDPNSLSAGPFTAPAGVVGSMPGSFPCHPQSANRCRWDYAINFQELNGTPATIERMQIQYIDPGGGVWVGAGSDQGWRSRRLYLPANGTTQYASWVRSSELRGGTLVINWEGHDALGNYFSGGTTAYLEP
jgi:uncharacterized protein YraI